MPVGQLDDTFIGYSGADREAKVRGRFADDTVARRLPQSSLHEAYSERSYFGGLIGILHPYSVLRVLGENAENREADVVWQYGLFSIRAVVVKRFQANNSNFCRSRARASLRDQPLALPAWDQQEETEQSDSAY